MRLRRLTLLVATVGIATIALAPAASATPRSGDIHIVKDCTSYDFLAGGSCVITSSNVPAIPPDTRIVYASAVDGLMLDTDIRIGTGPGNTAYGHCTINFADLPGSCHLSGGTGKFTHFQASVVVSPDATANFWDWDGEFSFAPGS